jgi:hypothetical protein
MRLTHLNKSVGGGLARVSAKVEWETCNQPSREIYIETEEIFADDIEPSADAFAVGALIPALHLGERRLAIDGEICPRLKEGLAFVMRLMQFWTQDRMQPLELEVGVRHAVRFEHRAPRTGLFLSGGIDSLAALRLNRLHYSWKHPGAVKDCLLVHGFDIGGVMARGMKYHVFDRAKAHLGLIGADAGVTLIPVYTNIRHLWDDRDLWLNQFFGAVLAAVAHAFSPRLSRVEIAASYDLHNLVPCGSHPMLDPEYSSFEMQIRHRDVELTRIEKIRIVAEWETALQNLRVCLSNVPERLNCGKCEKCVRTMTGLLAVGALRKTRAFVEDDITAESFDPLSLTVYHREPFYRELIEPLKAAGRHDLVTAITRKLGQSSGPAA